jgi:hypothetical protein
MKRCIFVVLLLLLVSPNLGICAKKRTQQNPVIDQEVLKEHQQRFGKESFGKRTVLNNRNMPRVVNVPILSKPSLVNSEPGEKNSGKRDLEANSEFPVLPKFPENSPYQPELVPLNKIFLDNRPVEKKYRWGKQEPETKKYRWGKEETGTKTQIQ